MVHCGFCEFLGGEQDYLLQQPKAAHRKSLLLFLLIHPCPRDSFIALHCSPFQGPTLRLTGRQCDQKLSVGDQKFRTGRQQATNLFSPLHLKFQGKWAFFKRKHKAAEDNCSKTKRRSYDHHIYPAPYCFSGFSKLTSPCLRWKI